LRWRDLSIFPNATAASPQARGSEATMDKLFFIGCLAFLVWCVWFFWVKD
jgi:hypothetical protein